MRKAKKQMTYEESLSTHERDILELVMKYDGFVNAHSHLDRADTMDQRYWREAGINPYESAFAPLKVKQARVGELHKSGAYDKEDLMHRMRIQIERSIAFHVKSLTTLIDATDDIDLVAIDAALELKEQFKGQIEILVGTQPIFGFRNLKTHPNRWSVFKAAAEKCDVIGLLPEKDEGDGRIGFDEHLKMGLELAIKLKKPVHVHIDQNNDPRQRETEKLVQAVHWLGSPKIEGWDGPTVFGVHGTSLACQDEKYFYRIGNALVEENIGIICCPGATVCTRQLRPLLTPTHNSINRILELIRLGARVFIGSDNIADPFVPSGDANMLKELTYLAYAIRYFVPKFLAKIGCGIKMNDSDVELISRALQADLTAYRDIDPLYLG